MDTSGNCVLVSGELLSVMLFNVIFGQLCYLMLMLFFVSYVI